MKKLTVLLLAMLVVLSMCGPVYAKSVTSSAGGIGTTHTGATYGSFEKSAGAGHSALLDFSMEDTISGDGATAKGSLSDSGTNVEDYATVAYKGTITWDASVKGGDGEVKFSTGLYAEADEVPDPYTPDYFWAETELWSEVYADAGVDAVAKGEVSSRGTATAGAVWDLLDGRTGSISSQSSGITKASVEVEDGSDGEAWADMDGYAEAAADGLYGFLSADIEAGGEIDYGTGEVESSASGTVITNAQAQSAGITPAESTLAVDPALFYMGNAVAEGSASGSLEAEYACGCYDNEYYTEIDVGSPYFALPAPLDLSDFAGGHIFAEGSLGSHSTAYDASIEAESKGSGLLTEWYGGWDRPFSAFTLDSVSGSASIKADQNGEGWIGSDEESLFAGLYAFDEPMPLMLEYPLWVDMMYGIGDRLTVVQFDEVYDDTAFILSEADLEGYDSSFRGSADAAASGKAISTSTYSDAIMGTRDSTQNNIVEGSTKAGVSSRGYSYGESDAIIASRSSIGPELSGTGWAFVMNPDSYEPVDLIWSTFAGTGGLISSSSEADGPATSASSAADGTAVGGAYGMIIEPGDPALVYIFDSAANVAGKVSSGAKSKTETTGTESASAIFATNAVGSNLFWDAYQNGNGGDIDAEFYFGDLHNFVASQHGLLTSAAVYSPGNAKSTATARAAGTANSAGNLMVVEDYSAEPDELWQVSSSSGGAGSLASDFAATDGLGISEAWINGGNFAGFDLMYGTPIIQSLDAEDWDAGIYTYIEGGSPAFGSVKGSASVKEGSSMETASITYMVQDPLDPEDFIELYALDTYSQVTDKASADLSVKKGGFGYAGSYVTAWNYATLDYGAQVGTVDADYNAGAYADTYGTAKAKASIKPWSIVTKAEYSYLDPSVFPPVSGADEILYIDSGAESAKSP